MITLPNTTKKIEIQDEDGNHIGTWEYNPNDIGILERIDALRDSFDGVEINTLTDAEKKIKEELDKCFGGNFSKVFFKVCSPLSVIGDKLYFELVIEQVRDYIVPEIQKAIKASEARLSKYIES